MASPAAPCSSASRKHRVVTGDVKFSWCSGSADAEGDGDCPALQLRIDVRPSSSRPSLVQSVETASDCSNPLDFEAGERNWQSQSDGSIPYFVESEGAPEDSTEDVAAPQEDSKQVDRMIDSVIQEELGRRSATSSPAVAKTVESPSPASSDCSPRQSGARARGRDELEHGGDILPGAPLDSVRDAPGSPLGIARDATGFPSIPSRDASGTPPCAAETGRLLATPSAAGDVGRRGKSPEPPAVAPAEEPVAGHDVAGSPSAVVPVAGSLLEALGKHQQQSQQGGAPEGPLPAPRAAPVGGTSSTASGCGSSTEGLPEVPRKRRSRQESLDTVEEDADLVLPRDDESGHSAQWLEEEEESTKIVDGSSELTMVEKDVDLSLPPLSALCQVRGTDSDETMQRYSGHSSATGDADPDSSKACSAPIDVMVQTDSVTVTPAPSYDADDFENELPGEDVLAMLFPKPFRACSVGTATPRRSRAKAPSKETATTAPSASLPQSPACASTALPPGAASEPRSRPATVPAAAVLQPLVLQQEHHLAAAPLRPLTTPNRARIAGRPAPHGHASQPQDVRGPRPAGASTARSTPAPPRSARLAPLGDQKQGKPPSVEAFVGSRTEGSLDAEFSALLPVYQMAVKRVPRGGRPGPRELAPNSQRPPGRRKLASPRPDGGGSRLGAATPERASARPGIPKAAAFMERAYSDARRLLAERESYSQTAWLKHFDKDGDHTISSHEFVKGMEELGYTEAAGHDPAAVFNFLDVDQSGLLTSDEIDQGQSLLWQSFRHWCSETFEDVGDLTRRLSPSSDCTISKEDFRNAIRAEGWTHGYEDLLFDSLDVRHEGSLGYWNMTWFEIEKRRWHLKYEARRRSVRRQDKKCNELSMARSLLENFREFLRAKFGSLFRAWRCAISMNDSLIVYKPSFLKACHKIGWRGDTRLLWRALDRDASNAASVEELDYGGAHHMARFQAWIKSTFKTASQAFAALDKDKNRFISAEEFAKALKSLGYGGPARLIFQALDIDASKFLVEDKLRFLEEWKPPEFMLAEPSPRAGEEFKALLLRRYKDFLRAWRQIDLDGNNRCHWGEFKRACLKVGFQGDVAGAWLSLDDNSSGCITLHELDAEAYCSLVKFKQWCDKEFGSVRSAFSVFDTDGNSSITRGEFYHCCRIFGFRHRDLADLMQALDVDRSDDIKLIEMTSLDDWEWEDEFAQKLNRRIGERDSEWTPRIRPSSRLQDADDAETFVWRAPGTSWPPRPPHSSAQAAIASTATAGSWMRRPPCEQTPRLSARSSVRARARERGGRAQETGDTRTKTANPYLVPGKAAWQSRKNPWCSGQKADLVVSLLGGGALPGASTALQPMGSLAKKSCDAPSAVLLADVIQAGRRPAPDMPDRVWARPDLLSYGEFR